MGLPFIIKEETPYRLFRSNIALSIVFAVKPPVILWSTQDETDSHTFCLHGNICRSPVAQGILAHIVEKQQIAHRIVIDSAGRDAWHVGNAPDPRSVAIAKRHGIDITGQKARQVKPSDFEGFDLILAMDEDNLARLSAICPVQYAQKLHLFSDYATGDRSNVPDPYYGGEDGFQTVYTMLFSGCVSLIGRLETGHAS